MKRILSKLPALLEGDKAAFTALLSLLLITGILLSSSPSTSQAAPQDWVALEGSGYPRGLLNSIFCLDEQRCWLTYGGFGGLVVTRDGGMTWQGMNSPRLLYYGGHYSPFFFDEARGFVSTSGRLYKTRDGGRTWEAVIVGGQELSGVLFIDQRTGYGLDSRHKMFKTRDSGETWELWPGQWPDESYVRFIDENIAWALQPSRTLSYTTDAWRSRIDINIGSEGDRYWPLDFLDYYNGWYGGCRAVKVGNEESCQQALLYRTRDAGQSWQGLSLPATCQYVSYIRFVNERTGWLKAQCSDKGTVLKTSDGGDTWVTELETSSTIQWLNIFNDRLGWAAIGPPGYDATLYKHYPNIALTPTPTPTPTPGPEARQNVIPRLYQEVLCRGIDPQGYQYWLNSPLTTEQIRQELINSPEGQRVAAVRTLYTSILARDPMPTDCGGLRSWVDKSLSLDAIRAGLEASGEGQRVAAVRQLYIELLGRDPLGSDNAGLRYWVQLPLPISEIRRLIMESEEYRQRHGG